MRQRRGYALMIVLLVLALLAVSLGTLFVFLEASGTTTGSMLERRRVFYACDGIGRATTVLAQRYMTTAAPSTAGLIDDVCSQGGGGCCPTTTAPTAATGFSQTGGACAAEPYPANATFTKLLNDPEVEGSATALPNIVPPGFKLKEFQIQSLAPACTDSSQCESGVCDGGFCRTIGPLPNGPFEGMNARQDTVEILLAAEHDATSQFTCRTRQTLTLGKIAMFQFFLFSDSTYTDWHPGPRMRASGRMHANGNLGLDNNVRIERVTAAGDIGCRAGTAPPNVGKNCTSANARIANRANPTMTNDSHFTAFARGADWTTAALSTYGNGNAQDAAHGVPRLQLPIVGSPQVQRGFAGDNSVLPNTNTVIVNGIPKQVSNSRLLIDPVRPADTNDIVEQKFAFKADIRIINGVWYLKDPSNPTAWPGHAIWSDHGTTHVRDDVFDLKRASDTNADVGFDTLKDDPKLDWGGRVPRRFSYYSRGLLSPELERDVTSAGSPSILTTRPVISYGSLARIRPSGKGEHETIWLPGVRSRGTRWCDAASVSTTAGLLDATNIEASCGGAAGGFTQGMAVLAAARSGFRDGFAEMEACGTKDKNNAPGTTCDGAPASEGDRRRGNILPLNFDLMAFQEALADTTRGELGSFFCPPGTPTCSAFMKAPFNGIVFIANPYRGSEDGYATNGGISQPKPLPMPEYAYNAAGNTSGLLANAAHVSTSVAGIAPLMVDEGGHAARDDETAALPYALCSDAAGPEERLTVGGTKAYTFRRPRCGDPTTYSLVNGVRLINARRVNSNTPTGDPPNDLVAQGALVPNFPTVPTLPASATGMLPNGLSFITNQNLYVLGDVNITSDAYGDPNTGGPWVPVLVGGDVVHPLSNAWDDNNARWATSNAVKARPASVTRYYMAILSGWGMSLAADQSGGIHNFPRALEQWNSCGFSDGCPAIIHGSMVIGHNRVYTSWAFREANADIGRSPPRRDWGFDRQLEDLTKQPPGAPLFDVAAVRQWTRR